jgi:hypothetical protein
LKILQVDVPVKPPLLKVPCGKHMSELTRGELIMFNAGRGFHFQACTILTLSFAKRGGRGNGDFSSDP